MNGIEGEKTFDLICTTREKVLGHDGRMLHEIAAENLDISIRVEPAGQNDEGEHIVFIHLLEERRLNTLYELIYEMDGGVDNYYARFKTIRDIHVPRPAPK